MKRACIVRHKVYPAQRNLRRSAETLAKAGYDVDVICLGMKGQKKQETMNGVNVHRIFMEYHRGKVFWYLFDYATFFIRVALRLAWFSLKKRYDVVEVHTMPDFLVFVTLFPKLMGSKIILYMFENTEWLFTSSFKVSPNHVGARLIRFIAKVSASYANHVIVSDGPLHKKAVESLGIPSKKVTMVLNVPDDTIFNIETVGGIEDGNHFYLAIASTILKRYGIQSLIKAIPRLLKDIPELKVDIIGGGDYVPDLEQMALDLGVKEYANFTRDFIPYESVPDYIARAHVCVAPMIDDVGAPCKIFEYMALGKPAVASDLPSLRALFGDSTLLYFQPDNSEELANRILELYHNPEKRASLGRAGQALYRKYSWSLMMRQEYLKTYAQFDGRK